MVPFQRLIKTRTTIFTFWLLPFSKTFLYISMYFHSLTYSISTTFYKVYKYIKTSKEIEQYNNELIYTYHKHST